MAIKKSELTNLIILIAIVFIIWGLNEWGYFNKLLNKFHSKNFESIEEITCINLQEYTIGQEIYNGVKMVEIQDIMNSKQESKKHNELICIGELIWDGVSGSNIRMEVSERGGKQWYDYRVID